MHFICLIIALMCPFLGCYAGSSKPTFKYELSVAAIFQNESSILQEWIEYHLLLGVEHFYLYNNNSTDDYQEVLAPYIEAKIVELKEWPSDPSKNWIPYQYAALWDAITLSRQQTNWLAMIDIDEFIVPHHTDSLKSFLRPYDKKKGVAGVIINWQMFGTSGLWEIPSDKLMIECLVHKAAKTWHHNQNFKSIIKPRYCTGHRIHYGTFINGWKHTHSKKCGSWPYINEIQVNHYWLRNEKWMREVKAPRRARYEGSLWHESAVQSYIEQTSSDIDLSIQRFVPALRKRVMKG